MWYSKIDFYWAHYIKYSVTGKGVIYSKGQVSLSCTFGVGTEVGALGTLVMKQRVPAGVL